MARRIGIPVIGSAEWIGGVSYVENLVKAVRLLPDEEQPELTLLVSDKDLEALPLHAHFLHLFDGVLHRGTQQTAVESLFGRAVAVYSSEVELGGHIDFVFPAPDFMLGKIAAASWIPDFQHVHLPQFFSSTEIQERERSFLWKSSRSQTVVFSSQSAAADFRGLYPKSSSRIATLCFHTLPESLWLRNDAVQVQRKYGLPDRFLLCSNQFWAHKNHYRVFEALGYLRLMGCPVSLVLTGSKNDYRHRTYFETLMRMPGALGIESQVHVLGNIPRIDQIQLMRRSLGVIQPSLFEGWSTVVEDARALGKVMFLSDIDVHREQSPDRAHYFPREDALALAHLIQAQLPHLEPGPQLRSELECARASLERVMGFGRKFMDICA